MTSSLASLEKPLAVELETFESPKLSLIIPVFNESEIITKNLKRLTRFLEHELAVSYELLVCDDCSQDNTYQKLVELKAEIPHMTLIRFSRRIGKGGTIKEAVRRARGKIVVVMDVDLSTKLTHLPQMISFLEEKGGILIGERKVSSRYSQGFFRTILSLTFNLLARIFLRTGVKDHQCGFKGMTRKIAAFLAEKIEDNGYLFDTELIFLAKKHKISLAALEVEWEEKRRVGRSKFWWTKSAIEMLKSLLKLRIKHPL